MTQIAAAVASSQTGPVLVHVHVHQVQAPDLDHLDLIRANPPQTKWFKLRVAK